jgi:hypothetical protein
VAAGGSVAYAEDATPVGIRQKQNTDQQEFNLLLKMNQANPGASAPQPQAQEKQQNQRIGEIARHQREMNTQRAAELGKLRNRRAAGPNNSESASRNEEGGNPPTADNLGHPPNNSNVNRVLTRPTMPNQ